SPVLHGLRQGGRSIRQALGSQGKLSHPLGHARGGTARCQAAVVACVLPGRPAPRKSPAKALAALAGPAVHVGRVSLAAVGRRRPARAGAPPPPPASTCPAAPPAPAPPPAPPPPTAGAAPPPACAAAAGPCWRPWAGCGSATPTP